MSSLYRYRGVNAHGNYVKGYMTGLNIRDVKKQLKAYNFYIFSLHKCLKSVGPESLSLFFLYLYYALRTGYPLHASLFMIQSVFKGIFKELLENVQQKIAQGSLFSSACNEYPMIFPPAIVTLIQIGEQSGKLNDVCYQAYHYLKKMQQEQYAWIKTLAYPLVNAFFLIGAFIVMAHWLLPQVIEAFQEKNLTLPLATQVLMILNSWTFIGIIVSFLSLFALLIPWRQPWFLKIFRRFWMRQAYINFFESLSLLIQAGLPLVQALSLSEQNIGSSFLRPFIHLFIDDIQQGKTIAQAIYHLPHFPKLYNHFLQAGERTGHQQASIDAVISIMRLDRDHLMNRLLFWTTPLSLLVMGGLFMLLIHGTVLPLYHIVGE